MAHNDAEIWMKDLKVGDFVDTGGIYYGPYNAMTCLAITENRVAVHVKGHRQFWGRQAHYIPAQVMVFEKTGEDGNRWLCRKIFEQVCGRRSGYWKSEAIRIAETGILPID